MNSSRIVLVCFAMPDEARPFRRRARVLPEVRVLVTGIGRRNAAATIEAWFAEQNARWVLTSGFAGGLDPARQVGDLVFNADEGFPGVPALQRFGAFPGRFHCADRIAITSDEKRHLRRTTGADAVDMESEPIRRHCLARGVPSATLRVISDAADEDLPLDFNRLAGANYELSYARLGGALLASPRRIPALIRFGQRTRRAAQRLADALAAVTAV